MIDDNYICDDRNVLESIAKIRSMTDDEFEEYIKELRKNDENNNRHGKRRTS